MIAFTKIRYKNFLSSGNTWIEIPLNQHLNTLIVGENGSGKSTLLDALTFGLFGKPFRKINKPQLVSSLNNGDCLVEIEFTIGTKNYVVRRGIKPSIFEIIIDGVQLDKLSHAKDFQELLETQLLRLNYKSFTQVVLLGSSSFVPFMQLVASARREVIEDLLDIQVFSSMNKILKQKMSEHRDATTENNTSFALKEQIITVQSKTLKNLRKDNQTAIDRHQKEIDKHNGEIYVKQILIAKLAPGLRYLEANTVHASTNAKKLADATKIRTQLQSKEKIVAKEIAFYDDNDECPVCQQDINEDFKHEALVVKKAKLAKLQTAQADIAVLLAEVGELVAADTDRIDEINARKLERSSLNAQIDAARVIIRSQQTNIDNLATKGDVKGIKAEVAKAKRAMKKLEAKKKILIEEAEVNKMAATLLKDSGIKTVIIKQYLPIMNSLINKYLAAMDFFVNFTLDENFNETIKSRFRDDFSYDSFSEGEKMRIDLALLFTWRTIAKLKNSASTNLLILDEVFDSSLDDAGTQEFLKILWTLGADQNVFVISHKTDQLVDKFSHVIRFEKVKGFSKIV